MKNKLISLLGITGMIGLHELYVAGSEGAGNLSLSVTIFALVLTLVLVVLTFIARAAEHTDRELQEGFLKVYRNVTENHSEAFRWVEKTAYLLLVGQSIWHGWWFTAGAWTVVWWTSKFMWMLVKRSDAVKEHNRQEDIEDVKEWMKNFDPADA